MHRIKLDRNGYAPSIMQAEADQGYCFRCGRTDRKLDRHEPFGGAYRDKSKALGLWVMLCHDPCHKGRGGVHQDAAEARRLRMKAQRIAMRKYNWTTDDFIRQFGKNYREE